ncbi:MAG TPA: SHOCT domain-containing protein [Streptosporangiaceae bacterium]|nr:SHOCT domain-containing protein [Streptosporangiaceae bacterium]
MNAVMALTAPRWDHMGDSGWSDGMWIWGSVVMILWLALAVVVTWLAVRSVNARAAAPREPSGAEHARDILAERYAKGEIDTEEYGERLARLG